MSADIDRIDLCDLDAELLLDCSCDVNLGCIVCNTEGILLVSKTGHAALGNYRS